MSLSCQLLQTFSKILWSLKSLFIIAILNGEGKILQSRFDCSILRVVFSVQTLYIVPYLALHQHDKTFKGYEGYKGYNVKWNIMQYILWVFHFSNKYWLFWVYRFKSSFFFIYTSSTFAMSSSQKYTYSDLTDEVHELNDLYKDMQEDNREMNARIISLQQEVRNLTHVIEEHQKVNDDVRNLLNYMSVQGSRK